MNSARQNILEAAARLFEKQGFHATGLNEIIRQSGSPKGSLYYYFPQGKEQVGAETALWSAAQMVERIRLGLSSSEDPGEAVQNLALGIAQAVENSGFAAGGPLMTMAAESVLNSEQLNTACKEAYALMQAPLEEKFGGRTDLAEFVLCTLEGAILLSRVNHSGNALRQAARKLKSYVQMEMNP